MAQSIKELFDRYCNLYTFEEGDPEYLMDEEDFIKAVKEFTELKCKETARNVRHSACEILNGLPIKTSYTQSLIMNIQDKDVIPEL